jgi:selenocysteine lyase/cysteine desulfurase/short-subunit dehydrogenase
VLEKKISEFRLKLPFLQQGLFLNYAATAPLTSSTIESMTLAVQAMQEPLGQHFYSALNQLEFARREFAGLINAKPGEIAFTQNTSMAISTVALAVDFKEGDRILIPDNEFPSNYYAWENLKHKGVLCEKFHVESNSSLVETLSKLDLTKVKLISSSAVSFQTGRVYDVGGFADFCRRKKIFSCLDAIQAIGAMPFDVHEIGVDFACSGAQKWTLGPVGCGMLYARQEILNSLNVPFVGWTSVMYPEYLDLGPLSFSEDMTRFEPGLPNFLPVVGLHSSLLELKKFGWSNIYNLIKQNTGYLQEQLQSRGFKLLHEGSDQLAGITSFYFPQPIDHRVIEEKFHDDKIKITARKDYVRVSPHFFNTRAELDLFLDSTDRVFNIPEKRRAHLVGGDNSGVSIGAKDSENQQLPMDKIAVCGAAGNLGKEICLQLAKQGFNLLLIDQNKSELELIASTLAKTQPYCKLSVAIVDLGDSLATSAFIERLQSMPERYLGLINCAGVIHAGLYTEMETSDREKIFRINYISQSHLMRSFMRELASEKCLGVLNVVSSTGRCGSPLLADYSASNAALWTLSESVARERNSNQPKIMTFVAPAMHSPMQKRIGRVVLRYFKAEGGFDYETATIVAGQVVKCFVEGQEFFISKLSRAKIFTNAIFSEYISKRIRKQWYTNE